MTDYIKREDAIDAVCGDCPYNCSEAPKEKHPCMEYKELMKIPSADVAPVRHGRWAETVTDGFLFVSCSACGFKTGRIDYNYCPNCGAKMDEGGE